MNTIGNTLIIIGIVFMGLGVFGLFRFKDFFSRILITAKVDTVGFIAIIIGLVVKNGFSFLSGKLLIILFLYLVTNPISTHSISRSAFLSGYRIKKENEEHD